jgi:hypothetical protein
MLVMVEQAGGKCLFDFHSELLSKSMNTGL